MKITRREFVKINICGVSYILFNPFFNNDDAEAVLWPHIIAIIGGIVISEILVGILKGYDISLSETIAKYIKGYREQNTLQSISELAKKKPGFRASGGPKNEKMVSSVGRRRSGRIQVGTHGILAQKRNEAEGYWIPGTLFWAATDGSKVIKRDLKDTRCGYPVNTWNTFQPKGKNYKIAEQKFEKGIARLNINLRTDLLSDKLLVADSAETIIGNVIKMNINERTWIPT